MNDSELGGSRVSGVGTVRAVLTDVQFWVPAIVLAGGIALLAFLH